MPAIPAAPRRSRRSSPPRWPAPRRRSPRRRPAWRRTRPAARLSSSVSRPRRRTRSPAARPRSRPPDPGSRPARSSTSAALPPVPRHRAPGKGEGRDESDGVYMSWGTRLVQMSLVLLAVAASSVAAADDKPKWEFEAEPYGWVSGNFGSVTVKGHTAQITVTPWDVYGLLEDGNAFAAGGYFAVSYDRFSVFADSMGGYAEESVNETVPTRFCTLSLRARDKVRFALADFALGYRLGEWSLPDRRRPLTLGVYAGTRYMYFGNKLNATGGV